MLCAVVRHSKQLVCNALDGSVMEAAPYFVQCRGMSPHNTLDCFATEAAQCLEQWIR